MRRFLFFLCAVCAASESFAAQITDTRTKFSMRCVAEKGTGYDWKNNDWVLSNYKPYSYVLTKVEPRTCFTGGVSQQISPDGNFMGQIEGLLRT